MEKAELATRPDRASILEGMVRILEEVTRDWDVSVPGGLGPDTRLIADLAFESIDVVQLVVAIEERFQRRDLPFERLLMVDGRYVDELTVSQVVDFLHRELSA